MLFLRLRSKKVAAGAVIRVEKRKKVLFLRFSRFFRLLRGRAGMYVTTSFLKSVAREDAVRQPLIVE